VNGQVFDNFGPQAIDSGGYTETALNNGDFSIVPGSSSGRRHSESVPTTRGAIRY